MTNDVASLVAHYRALRLTIGLLGEQVRPPWWRSSISSIAGQRFIHQRLFPRTGDSATIESLVRVARHHHDGMIAGGGAFHLFRLPLSIESALHPVGAEDPAGSAMAHAGDIDSLIESLSGCAQGPGSTGAGPVNCGSEALLWSTETIGLIAGHYLSAFRRGAQLVPYFLESPA